MLTAERKKEIEWEWIRRAWNAPFQRRLDDIMVTAYWNDPDYDAIASYLTRRFDSPNASA